MPACVFQKCEVLPDSFSFPSVCYVPETGLLPTLYNAAWFRHSHCVLLQSERARASACMHLHRALWRLKFRLNRCFFPFSSSCAWLVYDKSVALTPRVGRERECLWSDKLHIRALFNIPYMATSDELLRCQIEEQR